MNDIGIKVSKVETITAENYLLDSKQPHTVCLAFSVG